MTANDRLALRDIMQMIRTGLYVALVGSLIFWISAVWIFALIAGAAFMVSAFMFYAMLRLMYGSLIRDRRKPLAAVRAKVARF